MARSTSLDPYIAEVYERGSLQGDSGRWLPILPGGVDRTHGELLRDLIMRSRATRPIEIGLAPALSTLFICDALLATGHDDSRHVAIDPLQEILFDNIGLRSLERAGVRQMVDFIAEPSDQALPYLLRSGRRFDFAFVDGDHHFDNAFVDCFYCLQLLEPGSLLVVDDTWMPGLDLVVRYLEKNMDCELVELPRHGSGRLAVLRVPGHEQGGERPWDSFDPFVPATSFWIRALADDLLRGLRRSPGRGSPLVRAISTRSATVGGHSK
jgi:predicted O-methyltransferase YrrM